MRKQILLAVIVSMFVCSFSYAQQPELVIVRPQEIDDVLVNPGIGFMTFQRFNGDTLNYGSGWTEGSPIEYQDFDGDLTNPDHPATSLAYFRVYWQYVEPERGKYNWSMLDKALITAAERGQTLILRIAPYGSGAKRDVPAWYRELVGEEKEGLNKKWRTDPENPLYVKHFGGLIRKLGARYDGHPDMEAIDIATVGFWGEGAGSHLLSDKTRIALLEAYLEGFKKTELIYQPLNGDAPDPGLLLKGVPIAAVWQDGTNNGPGMRHVGWRLDCLGDMGFWHDEIPNWCHMLDAYPQDIIKSGMKDAWKKGHITMEICGTFLSWRDRQGYGEEMVSYILDQALDWHISSFNAKSSAVPPEWMPLVDEWLKKMGYRLVLRKFTFPSVVSPHGQLPFTSWWKNKGVAPCYKDFQLALRLKGKKRIEVLVTAADIRTWLPGDVLYDNRVYLPLDMPEGVYELQVGIVDRRTREPRVRLAIEGRTGDGWYPMGDITVKKSAAAVSARHVVDNP